jgi:hypothetical protein
MVSLDRSAATSLYVSLMRTVLSHTERSTEVNIAETAVAT